MADKTLEVLMKILYDDKGAKLIVKDFKQVEKVADKSATGLDKVKKSGLSLDGVFKKIVAGGALLAIGNALVGFAKESISVASNVEEAASKFSFVFGPAAEDTGRALDEFAEAAGRSRYELRETAAGFGGMLEGMMGSKDAAADMSIELSRLTTDLASFYNVAEQDVAGALQSGLVGETEPMRRFGVLINAAAIENEILASGMARTKSEITETMKVQARYNLILAGTATAQGDAERTSDSYANQQRALQASLQELSVTLGQELIPMALELTKVMIEMIDRMGPSLDALTGKYGDTTQDIVTSNIEAAKSIDDLIAQGKRIQEVGKIWGGFGVVVTGTQDDLKKSSIELVEAIARTSTSAEEMESALTEALGGGIFDRGGEKFLQVSTGLGYIDVAMSDLADMMGKEIPPNSELAAMAMWQMQQQTEETAAAADRYVDKFAKLPDVLEKNARQSRATAQAERELEAELRNVAAAAEELRQADFASAFTTALDDQTNAYGRWVTTATAVGGLTEGQQSNFEDLTRTAESLQEEINSLNGGTAGLGLSEDQLNEKLAKNYEQLGLVEGAIANLGDTAVTYTDVQQKWVVDAEAMNQQLFDQITANTDNEVAIAAAGMALGLYDEAQVEAALNAAIINEQINALAQSFVNGEITAGQMRERMQDIVDGSPYTSEIEAIVDDAIANIDKIKSKLDGIDRHIKVNVDVTETTRKTGDASAGASSSGRGGNDANHATGTNGMLTVPPGYPGDSYSVGMTSGEKYQVIPQGGGGGGGNGDISISFAGAIFQGTNQQQANQIVTMVADKLGALQ